MVEAMTETDSMQPGELISNLHWGIFLMSSAYQVAPHRVMSFLLFITESDTFRRKLENAFPAKNALECQKLKWNWNAEKTEMGNNQMKNVETQ